MFKRSLAVLSLAVAPLFAADPAAPADRPSIEIAICLDTSNSMDGLIDAARQKLWTVVTDMGTAQPTPALRVALYHYGNTRLSSETGWVEELCPLTDDLDLVYEKLFALSTSGGTEYVARAIKTSTESLAWSDDADTLRMIVIAGNEPATQDPHVTLEAACSLAAGKGIIVNTIFCGPEETGRSSGWAAAARLADGRFSAIDQNGGTVVIATPFDAEIARLGAELNSTYLAFGAAGQDGYQRQVAQDANAVALSAPAAAERAAGKAQAQYSNARWDLVDAARDNDKLLSQLKREELPAAMQPLTPDERQAFVQEKANERKEIQSRINALNAQRAEHQKQEIARRGLDTTNSFDAALRATIREQAAAKGINFQP